MVTAVTKLGGTASGVTVAKIRDGHGSTRGIFGSTRTRTRAGTGTGTMGTGLVGYGSMGG